MIIYTASRCTVLTRCRSLPMAPDFSRRLHDTRNKPSHLVAPQLGTQPVCPQSSCRRASRWMGSEEPFQGCLSARAPRWAPCPAVAALWEKGLLRLCLILDALIVSSKIIVTNSNIKQLSCVFSKANSRTLEKVVGQIPLPWFCRYCYF